MLAFNILGPLHRLPILCLSFVQHHCIVTSDFVLFLDQIKCKNSLLAAQANCFLNAAFVFVFFRSKWKLPSTAIFTSASSPWDF